MVRPVSTRQLNRATGNQSVIISRFHREKKKKMGTGGVSLSKDVTQLTSTPGQGKLTEPTDFFSKQS